MFVSLLQILQYAQYGLRVDATMLHPGQIAGLFCFRVPDDHSEKREMLPSSGRYRNRSHTLPAPGGANRWLVGYARFIEKAKDCFVFDAPFLIVGQVVFTQVVMAFSSRSLALRSGL